MAFGRREFLTALGAVATMAAEVPTRTPVLVELFTSQGCSSCPPADSLLARLVEEQPVAGAEIIGLSQHVDYWNRLGWKDPYSSAANTERQVRYQRQFRTESVYTQLMVVNGRREFLGSDAKKALEAIRVQAAQPRVGLELEASGGMARIAVSAGDLRNADLLVALVQREAGNPVSRGENQGRTLRHRNVLNHLGKALLRPDGGGGKAVYRLPPLPSGQPADWRVVAFLQDRASLAILGATVAPYAK